MFPWVGRSPLRVALDTGKMAAGAERSVADEISTTTGHLLAHPENTTIADAVQTTIRALRGRLAFVKSWATGMGEGKSGAPASDWTPHRIGPDVPASSLEEAVAANACAHLIDSTRIQTLLTFDEVIGLLGPAVFGLEPEPVPPPAPAPAPAP